MPDLNDADYLDELLANDLGLLRKFEAAIRRADLRRNGIAHCPRCASNQCVSKCSGQSEAPELCSKCVDEVVDLQEKAYGEGWSANRKGERPRVNPYRGETGLDDNTRFNQWNEGWQDAEDTIDPADPATTSNEQP